MHIKSVHFHLLEDGTVDCHYQEHGGPAVSFDPAQIPAKLAEVIGELVTAQQTALVTKDAQVTAVIAERESLIATKEAAEKRAADYAAQLAAIALASPAPKEAASAPADVP